ncbi:hypothetical protein [Flavobacterium sp. N3904]|nr:hypothetical protein [Flavobacterium sp. N3904]
MKRTLLLLTAIAITSCSSSNHVCGGSGGKRCVEVTTKINTDKIS